MAIIYCRKKLTACLASSIASFLHYKGSRNHPEKADTFFERLETGADLSSDSPIYLLRERMIRNRRDKAKLPTWVIMALSIKAWNAFAMDRPMKHLRFSTEGNTVETFPEII